MCLFVGSGKSSLILFLFYFFIKKQKQTQNKTQKLTDAFYIYIRSIAYRMLHLSQMINRFKDSSCIHELYIQI